MEEIDYDEGRKTHYCENLLSTQVFVTKKKSLMTLQEGSDKNKNLGLSINNNIIEKRSGSLKRSSKKMEIYNFDDLTEMKDLLKIIGENYSDIMKNNNLMSKSEKFLLNLRNTNSFMKIFLFIKEKIKNLIIREKIMMIIKILIKN